MIAAKKYTPEDKHQALVVTPYGRGLVIRSNRDGDGIHEIQLTEWELANNKKRRNAPKNATLYTSQTFPSVKPLMGDHVVCTWGRGKVIGLKEGQIVVELTTWRLAQRSTVKCYLDPASVQVVRKKIPSEMDVYERVELGTELKARASKQFGHKMYEPALVTYAKAVDAVRYVQHDAKSSNEVRTDLVVLMITCCNNAGTCCRQIQKWDECISYAKNGLVLLDALDEKRGRRIHTILNKDGYSDQKVFGEWKVKSHLLMARGYFEKQDYAEAIKSLETAAMTLDGQANKSPTLLSQEKELRKLKAHCAHEQKAVARMEKKRAQAMFGGAPTTKKPRNGTNGTHQTAAAEASPGTPKSIIKPVEADIDSPKIIKKSVSFSNPLDNSDGDDDDDEAPWYEEHMEALILTAGFVAIGAAVLLRGGKR